ncbi:MAG: polysaccharide deacetylase family protein [Phycisphaerales bacterium]
MPSALVLCFHRVVPDAVADDYWPWVERGSAITVSRFESILDHLVKTHRWIDEQEAADRLVRGRGSADRACWITFDDGYRDNLDVAAPILKSRGISPTLFISTRVLQAGFRLPVDRWYSALLAARASSEPPIAHATTRTSPFDSPESRMALLAGPAKQRFVRARKPEQDILLQALKLELGRSDSPDHRNERTIEYLRADDLDALCALGWRIGPHGASHELLHTLPDDELEAELLESHAALSGVRRRSSWTAWPDGAWNPAAASMMQRMYAPLGFCGCLSVEPRAATAADHAWAMPRVIPCRENGWACDGPAISPTM